MNIRRRNVNFGFQFHKIWRVLPIVMLACVARVYAGAVDSSVIGMFPKDSGGIGYADLSQARQLSWYPQLEAQVVPVALFGFEQFLEHIQMTQTSPIDQVAWAEVSVSNSNPGNAEKSATSTGGGPVGVAIGNFEIDTIESYLDSQKIPAYQSGNYRVYSSGTGSGAGNIFFTPLDSHTIAFGSLEPLKRLLRTRDGLEDSLLQNEPVMTLIQSANGECIFWGVLNSAGAAGAIQRLVPQAAQFPQSRDLIGKLKQVLITVKAPDKIDVELQAASSSTKDAVLLSQLLQSGALVRGSLVTDADNPEMSKLLDAIQIGANGSNLDIVFALTNEQLLSLIEHNTFSGML
ncbi:MAG TPA: hypothetical protein VFE02_15445 [Candidatus Acidoferrales bacterium]|jgi:hypothetical protein|nr:hypothetical protein [Candidatus Acidoferrales bacterium]